MKRSGAGRPVVVAEVVAVLLPVLVMFALGLWGLDRGGMWRDEAATFQVARRSLPQIWHLLHHVDAVHGLYYLFMHAVLASDPGEVALRLPSVCGAAAAAGLVAALGVRLCRPRVGLWAGLLYAVTPMAGHFAQEGRSYALVAAGAAGATLLLVRGVRSAGTGVWWGYGATVAVTCLLHEFAVLLLLAHATTLASARLSRRVWRRWGRAAGGAVLVLSPLVLVSHGQSGQVAWLTAPDWESVDRLLREFAGPTQPVFVPYLFLIVLGVLRPVPRGEVTLAAVAAPLMVLPPAVLITVSRFWPLYDERYVLYSLAGAPLLAAAGTDRLARAVARPWVRWTGAGSPWTARTRTRLPVAALAGVLAVALALTAQFPLLCQDRAPGRRPDNLAAVSAAAGRELRPGDPVLFLPSLARRSALAYPKGFRGARDVALRASATASGTLYGEEEGPAELRRRLAGLDHVWLVAAPFALRPGWHPHTPTERVKLAVIGAEFTLREQYARRGITLRLYVRSPSADDPGTALRPVWRRSGAGLVPA
ncbi:glycosyltransferase family 39 protein [Streptomyces sp. NBC_01571]|uniref:glycosyltransferase family 39 protein n=1 Tax=Streptomyces sp. NBC_01571 TaxID=2975883 RepID=UPI00225A77F0|nr:glycosyltransferase family 39 protein [Streptomyces sp. NBC_01571]MCX4575331.1 glycosyltransferase family 39 protein [Streptomyces sp. NBC_01571]